MIKINDIVEIKSSEETKKYDPNYKQIGKVTKIVDNLACVETKGDFIEGVQGELVITANVQYDKWTPIDSLTKIDCK